MADDIRETLTEVANDVFEKFAFMFVEDADEECDIETFTFVRSTLEFSGDVNGTMMIAMPDDLHLELAANVLGMDMDDVMVAEQADDAVKELLNVLCGHMLTAVFGEEGIYNLGAPQIAHLDKPQWNALQEESDVVQITVDDRPVLLRFST